MVAIDQSDRVGIRSVVEGSWQAGTKALAQATTSLLGAEVGAAARAVLPHHVSQYGAVQEIRHHLRSDSLSTGLCGSREDSRRLPAHRRRWP